MIVQRCALLLDFTKASLLRDEFGANRWKLVAQRVQCTPIVVKVPFCLLEVGATLGQHGKRRRRGRFTRRHHLLEVRRPGQQFIPCDCQCVALDCKSRAIPLQAVIRRG